MQGTEKKDKNELLFKKFDINYNSLDQIFRKGTVLIWAQPPATQSEAVPTDSTHATVTDLTRSGRTVLSLHEDIVGEGFWTKYPNILI